MSSWGPSYVAWDSPSALDWDSLPVSYMQQRVVAAASLLRGLVPYAHHHMAYWNVPDSWVNITVQGAAGGANGGGSTFTPGIGLDCSDMSHFSYNWGLGVSLNSDVADQGAAMSAPYSRTGMPSTMLNATVVFNATQMPPQITLAELVSLLQPGDLLYIRGDATATGGDTSGCEIDNPITHVVMYLGALAYDTNDFDHVLVFDSHGGAVQDSNNVTVPTGPHIRPMRDVGSGAQRYYYDCLQHVLRWI